MTRQVQKREPEFDEFLQELALFLQRYRQTTGLGWNLIADEAGLNQKTVYRLAAGLSSNPMTFTLWRVLRACNRLNVIDRRPLRTKMIHLVTQEKQENSR